MQTATFEEARPFCARLTPETTEQRGSIELFYSHNTPITQCRETANTVVQWLGDNNMNQFTMVRHGQAPRQHGAALRRTTVEYRSTSELTMPPHELLHYELQELVQPHCGYVGNAAVEFVPASAATDPAYRLTIARKVWETELEEHKSVTFDEQLARTFMGSAAYTFLHPWTEKDGPFSPEGALLVAEHYMRAIDAFPLNGIVVRA